MCTSTMASALRASETSQEIAARLPRTRPATRLTFDLPDWLWESGQCTKRRNVTLPQVRALSPRDLVLVGRYRRSELRRN
jgi:hypothetical protein